MGDRCSSRLQRAGSAGTNRRYPDREPSGERGVRGRRRHSPARSWWRSRRSPRAAGLGPSGCSAWRPAWAGESPSPCSPWLGPGRADGVCSMPSAWPAYRLSSSAPGRFPRAGARSPPSLVMRREAGPQGQPSRLRRPGPARGQAGRGKLVAGSACRGRRRSGWHSFAPAPSYWPCSPHRPRSSRPSSCATSGTTARSASPCSSSSPAP